MRAIALMLMLVCASVKAEYDENTEYVNFCAGRECVYGEYKLTKLSVSHLKRIYEIMDTLDIIEFLVNYSMKFYEIFDGANNDNGQLEFIYVKIRRTDWDDYLNDFVVKIPRYKMSVLNKELNYILYEHISKKSPIADQQFWRKMKLTIVKGMQGLTRNECDGVYLGHGTVNNMPMECQLSLVHHSRGWDGKVSMKIGGRSNIVRCANVRVDNFNRELEMTNAKDPRNKFYGDIAPDRKSILLISKFNDYIVWKIQVRKN